MTILLTILHVFVCIFLILVILLQAGRGHGLATSSFGSGAQTLFGTKTTTFMNRLTGICAILFLLTSLSLVILSMQKGRSVFSSNAITQSVPVLPKGAQPVQAPAKVAAKTDAMPAESAAKTPTAGPAASAPTSAPVEKK